MNFYRLTTALTNLLRTIEDGGELTDEQILLAAEVEKDIPRAVDNLCRLVRETSMAALAARQEAQWFALRARQQEDANTRFKDILLNLMKKAGLPDATTDLFSVRVQKSPPALRVGEDFDPKSLLGTVLEPLTVTKVSLNADAVKSRWKDNPDSLPDGVSVVQGEHVRISPR